MKAVKKVDADLGIAHDGYADRMMAVDDKGRFVLGDKLLAIFAKASGAKRVVTTIDASMSIDELGFDVRRTKVGDPYVSDELKGWGDFGGEPAGAWVFPGVSLCPDGIYAAARLVALASEQKLSQLADSIPAYPVLRGSIDGKVESISELEKRLVALKPRVIRNEDGIKLDFTDGWLLIRPSGTESKTRLTAEAKSAARAHQLYNSGVKAVEYCIKAARRTS
jgi:phosphoglucosamine mutase